MTPQRLAVNLRFPIRCATRCGPMIGWAAPGACRTPNRCGKAGPRKPDLLSCAPGQARRRAAVKNFCPNVLAASKSLLYSGLQYFILSIPVVSCLGIVCEITGEIA